MSMTISNSSASPMCVAPNPPGLGDDAKALGKALRGGDLEGARAAYVGIVKSAPEGSAPQAGTPFAALGKALKAGDIEAAKAAFMDAARNRFKPHVLDNPDAAIVRAAPEATTNADAGGPLHVVA